MSISNGPPVTIELSAKLADFVVDNCDSNIGMGLSALQQLSYDNQVKMVELLENFKELRKLVMEARS